MLDNFSAGMLSEAAEIRAESALEVSGNLTVENAASLPSMREWFLSSGALTKHVQAMDLSLRLTS
jgi:nicotinate-nucleotide pyrophosphorylase (carboxylating)